ncbi:hypothetical protein [Elioraea rosea]|uniref:hypothetical protein n=1 Tax=Elioraea rosea TaxID=2492390 RepID=UPI001183313B|nr:hypothetical protein [Elioraea rosea]
MASATTILRLAQHGTAGGTRRVITVEQRRNHVALSRSTTTMLMLETDAPPPRTHDGALFCVLQHAMRLGSPVHVEGTLSPRALRNQAELQTYWARWRRGKLSPVRVTADALAPLSALPPQRALAVFSGGVDATATLLRHTGVLPKEEAEPLATALMVHGFDVPLEHELAFNRLVARVMPLLAERGVPLMRLRTDVRTTLEQDWEDSHGLQLGCMLHQYAHEFGIGLIGSGEPIDLAVPPWGSTMATDHLMSGDDMAMRHDGGGFTRTEKLALIAHHPTALATLKVCWLGPQQDVNCGVCAKCVRTRLAMFACGVTETPCFDTPFHPSHIASLELYPREADRFDEILRQAALNGIDAPWTHQLRHKLQSFRRADRYRYVGDAWHRMRATVAIRTRLRALAARFGMQSD